MKIKLCPTEGVFTLSVRVDAGIAARKDYINMNSAIRSNSLVAMTANSTSNLIQLQ